jgi:4'-phosphopantetheinyl transferase
LAALLPDAEWQELDRCTTDQARLRHLVSRGVVRAVLGSRLRVEPAALRLLRGPFGKPILASGPDEPPLHFNLAHSAELLLLAVSTKAPVGVDLERVRPLPWMSAASAQALTPRERTAWEHLPPSEKISAFFTAWTCKEAFLKAVGVGLSGLQRIEVALHPSEPPRLIIPTGTSPPGDWEVKHWSPFPGYMAAVVAQGRFSLRSAPWPDDLVTDLQLHPLHLP